MLSHDEEELILQHHMAPSPNDVAVFYFPPAVGGGDGDFLWKEVDKCIDALIFKKVDVIGVWEHAWHYNSMRGGKRIDFMPENIERKCRHVYKIGRRRNMVDFGKQIAVEVARRAHAFHLDTTTPIFEGFTVLQSRKFRVATQNRSTPLTVFQESACSAFTFENGRRVNLCECAAAYESLLIRVTRSTPVSQEASAVHTLRRCQRSESTPHRRQPRNKQLRRMRNRAFATRTRVTRHQAACAR